MRSIHVNNIIYGKRVFAVYVKKIKNVKRVIFINKKSFLHKNCTHFYNVMLIFNTIN